ncbi:Synaptotagmin-4 [Trichinella zimbabwensis]|uniref:Synaptotagmin-4 n=1 Tax=Trichinella zimbabwensis TaxID=268475 RepID=A0A0V1GYH0_9BILA|nr:Synaptotagmin-4 [Trichinella zimbabwensis]
MNSTSVPLKKQLQIFYKDFPKSLLRHLNFFDLLCTSIGINIFFLGLAALSNIKRWKKRGKSDQDFFLPFILAWIGSFLWTVYGFLVTNWQIELVNGYLTAANSVVLIALYIYRIRKKSLAAVIFITGLAAGSLLLLLTQLPNITSVHLVGSICSCMQIGCACTMLYMIVLAIKKKRIDFIPFLPVAQIFNIEFQVTLYSIWIEDFYLLISNGIFMTIDGLVFLLFFIYPSEPTTSLAEANQSLSTLCYLVCTGRCVGVDHWFVYSRLVKHMPLSARCPLQPESMFRESKTCQSIPPRDQHLYVASNNNGRYRHSTGNAADAGQASSSTKLTQVKPRINLSLDSDDNSMKLQKSHADNSEYFSKSESDCASDNGNRLNILPVRRKSSKRLLPPTPVCIANDLKESVIDSEDDSYPSKESQLTDELYSSDICDSSTPSSTGDATNFLTIHSSRRRSRILPTAPIPQISRRSVELSLSPRYGTHNAEDFLKPPNEAERRHSASNVLHASKMVSTRKPSIDSESLESFFDKCSLSSSKSRQAKADDNESHTSAHLLHKKSSTKLATSRKVSRNASSIEIRPIYGKTPPASSSVPDIAKQRIVTPVGQEAKRGSWPGLLSKEGTSFSSGFGFLHFSIQYFPVRKRLRVLVIKAEGLILPTKRDIVLNTFLKIFLSPGKQQKQRSRRLIKHAKDAVYNEEFFFVNITEDDIKTKSVEIRLCNHATKQFHNDRVIGEVKLPLHAVPQLWSKQEIHFIRNLSPKQVKKLGRIHLGITLEASARRLTINIAKIDDLPKYGIYGPPDPYVRITLNQNQVIQSKQTRTLKNTCNPVFREAVMFLVSVGEEDLENTSLVVSVMDALRPNCPSSVIGEVILSKIAEEKSCAEQWRMMLASPGKEIKASHTLKNPSE